MIMIRHVLCFTVLCDENKDNKDDIKEKEKQVEERDGENGEEEALVLMGHVLFGSSL